jgi:ribonucleoside-diphosphate reductase alpha chain
MVVKDDKNDTGKTSANGTNNVVTITAKQEPMDLDNEDGPPLARRHRLPNERASITHKFNVGGHEGYITVGVYPSQQPGEIFITMAKEGSTVSGLMDSFALAVSMALQHGVPLKLLCNKFSHTRFEPSGWTGNENIGYATSIMDYIFRWLEQKFVTGQQQLLFPGMKPQPGESPAEEKQSSVVGRQSSGTMPVHAADAMKELVEFGDAPSCNTCGSIMTRNGSCFRCMSCGSTSGCS